MDVVSSAVGLLNKALIVLACLGGVGGLAMVGFGLFEHDGSGIKRGLWGLGGAAVLALAAGLVSQIEPLLK